MHTELKQSGASSGKIKLLPKHAPRTSRGQCKDQYSPLLVLKLQKIQWSKKKLLNIRNIGCHSINRIATRYELDSPGIESQ
jgi:hypothetical protein